MTGTKEIFIDTKNLIGKKLGKYVVEEKLGRGGEGVVFKVQDTLEDGAKAIKMVPSQIADSPVAFKELKREVNNACGIIHPNVVKVMGLEEQEGLFFIVMEYIEGRSLEEMLASSDGRLDEAEVTDIMKKLAQGLSETHKNKVIHRDIKPSNVMVSTKEQVKILDFGISYQVTKSMTQLVGDSHTSGTWPYMAPEQISNRFGRENEQVDVWGFGVTMYQLLTGELPFKDKDQIKDKEEKPFEPQGISKKSRDIVMKCLEKDREKRFKNMGEVLNALNEVKVKKADEEKPENKKPKWILFAASIIVLLALAFLFKDQIIPPTVSNGDEQKKVQRDEEFKKYLNQATILLNAGDIEKAIEFLKGAKEIKTTPEIGKLEDQIIENYLEKVDNYLRNKDFKEADKYLDLAKKIKETKKIKKFEDRIKGEKEFEKLMNQTTRHLERGDIIKARKSLNQAKSIEQTEKTKEIENQINKIEKFKDYAAKARNDFNEKKYDEAMRNISAAEKIEITGVFNIQKELKELKGKIQEEKDRIEKSKQDDQDYQLALSINIVSAYIEYLKKHQSGKHVEEAKNKIQQLKPADVRAVEPKAKKVYINKKNFWEAEFEDGIIMVYIPPGEFIMGSYDGGPDERPIHTVFLDGYWMGKHEVTVKQYMAFVNHNRSHRPEWLSNKDKYEKTYRKLGSALKSDNYPIVGISWKDAKAYCKWLLDKMPLKFNLPTEAQWEKAARGTDKRKYPWGNHAPYYKGRYYANYDPGNNIGDGFKYTAPVDSFSQGASPYGLLNTAGNVREWCNDWYHDTFYADPRSRKRNPTGPYFVVSDRVVRSGSWFKPARDIRCANRSFLKPSYRDDSLGFRLCMVND